MCTYLNKNSRAKLFCISWRMRWWQMKIIDANEFMMVNEKWKMHNNTIEILQNLRHLLFVWFQFSWTSQNHEIRHHTNCLIIIENNIIDEKKFKPRNQLKIILHVLSINEKSTSNKFVKITWHYNICITKNY